MWVQPYTKLSKHQGGSSSRTPCSAVTGTYVLEPQQEAAEEAGLQ